MAQQQQDEVPFDANAAAARTRALFVHAWKGYEKYAFGQDELLPISKKGGNRWGHLGITLLDSLDTMLLLDLRQEYLRARSWVEDVLHQRIKEGGDVPFFEITIRALGGLLSAYTLTEWRGSSDHGLLEIAMELGIKLFPAIQLSPSGVPYCTVNLKKGDAHCPDSELGESIPLSELGSVQLEFAALGSLVGHRSFSTQADHAIRVLRKLPSLYGLYPSRIRPGSGGPASKEVGYGAGSDSFYETLLKRWLQGGKTAPWLQRMYRESLKGLQKLLRRSHPNGLLFVARANGGNVGSYPLHALREMHTFEHLTCFLPGLLILGAHHQAGLNATWETEVARELLDTCTTLYDRSPSGLGPERVAFVTERAVKAAEEEAQRLGKPYLTVTEDFDVTDAHWHLRPEYLESLYLMWKFDGQKQEYRQRGLKVLTSIEKHCRVPGGFAALRDHLSPKDSSEKSGSSGAYRLTDRQESFFLAETVKYLFLLFSDPSKLDLDKYVLTTEAHILPVLDSSNEDVMVGVGPTGEHVALQEADPVLPPWWRDGGMLEEAHVLD